MSRADLIQEIVETLAKAQRPTNFSNWPKLGLSPSQAGMIGMLSHHKKLQVKQMAEYLGITKSAVSQLIDPLITKGFVERDVDANDRRIIYFSLTNKGKKIYKKIHELKFAGLYSRLESLTTSDLDQLVNVCRKIAIVSQKNK